MLCMFSKCCVFLFVTYTSVGYKCINDEHFNHEDLFSWFGHCMKKIYMKSYCVVQHKIEFLCWALNLKSNAIPKYCFTLHQLGIYGGASFIGILDCRCDVIGFV